MTMLIKGVEKRSWIKVDDDRKEDDTPSRVKACLTKKAVGVIIVQLWRLFQVARW